LELDNCKLNSRGFQFIFIFYILIIQIVVWNPWDKKAKAMSDFGDEEYKQMVCVEAAAIEEPITLKPSEEWTGRLQLSLLPNTHIGGSLDVPDAL
jgi:Aldose 1-epimerase